VSPFTAAAIDRNALPFGGGLAKTKGAVDAMLGGVERFCVGGRRRTKINKRKSNLCPLVSVISGTEIGHWSTFCTCMHACSVNFECAELQVHILK